MLSEALPDPLTLIDGGGAGVGKNVVKGKTSAFYLTMPFLIGPIQSQW